MLEQLGQFGLGQLGQALAPDNQRVTHQSGASRLMNSIFMAMCFAPIVVILTCVLLGWNERRAVCEQKAISQGEEVVRMIGCDDPVAEDGELVLFSCDIDNNSLPELSLNSGTDFMNFQHQGTGIKVESEMYQCVENEHTETSKNKVGGGTQTVHTYTYKQQWESQPVNSAGFHATGSVNFEANCGMQNPSWDSKVPRSQTRYATDMKVGAFDTRLANKVPLETPLSVPSPGRDWREVSTGSFYRGVTRGPSSYRPKIGDVRVSLYSNDPEELGVTVLGYNDKGSIQLWTAKSTWLCSGFTLQDLKMGTISKEDFFMQLAAESAAMTWILRIVGFALMWCAFNMMFGPLEVVGDCIPFIGPCIGDAISGVVCCIACLPATACTLGVVGVVWVTMRPMVGIPLMVIFCLIVVPFGFFFATRKGKRRASTVTMSPAAFSPENNYQTELIPQAKILAQPQQIVAQPQRQMQVQVPPGVVEGQMLQIATPDGTPMQVAVPAGVPPGGGFLVNY